MKNIEKPEIMYVEAQDKSDNKVNTRVLANLPKKLLLLYSIQYGPLAIKIKQHLESSGHDIISFEQVLGCSKLSEKNSKTPILLVGSGKFHAINLALQTNSPIYIYESGKINLLSKEDMSKIRKNQRLALLKFLSAEKIGILVSTKPGQNRLKHAKALKNKLEKKAKKAYILISNNLNLAELENFQLPIYVNTACPGLAYDSSKIINMDDLSTILKNS